MRHFRFALAVLTLGAIAGSVPASAARDNGFAGVWVTDAQFCPLMQQIGTRAIFGNDIAIVTLEQGLIGDEFFCSFDEFSYGPDGKSVVISATCSDSSESFPETVYLDFYESDRENAPVRFEFNSGYVTGQSRPGNGDEDSRFLFSRCDKLTTELLMERSEP